RSSGVALHRLPTLTQNLFPSKRPATGKILCVARTSQFRSGRVTRSRENNIWNPYEHQKAAKNIREGVKEIEQLDSCDDKNRAQEQRANHAAKQHFVLGLRRHPKSLEDDQKYEDVVEAEGLLHHVGGKEIESGPGPHGKVDPGIEGKGRGDPAGALDEGAPEGDRARLTVECEEVNRQRRCNDGSKYDPGVQGSRVHSLGRKPLPRECITRFLLRKETTGESYGLHWFRRMPDNLRIWGDCGDPEGRHEVTIARQPNVPGKPGTAQFFSYWSN